MLPSIVSPLGRILVFNNHLISFFVQEPTPFKLENVMSAIEDHNAEFNNDLEVEFSNKEELCQE